MRNVHKHRFLSGLNLTNHCDTSIVTLFGHNFILLLMFFFYHIRVIWDGIQGSLKGITKSKRSVKNLSPSSRLLLSYQNSREKRCHLELQRGFLKSFLHISLIIRMCFTLGATPSSHAFCLCVLMMQCMGDMLMLHFI